MIFLQATIDFKAPNRGFHLVTDKILNAIDIKIIRIGVLNIFLRHTSASLTINENISPDVRRDLESISSSLIPDDGSYEHILEGYDDMPSHFKSSIFGVSLNIPIKDGELTLGTWQGIYLNEHRDKPTKREIVLTAWGTP